MKKSHVTDATELSMLRAIAERPDDDAAVEVYGDFLSERDDPRGEFIALSLAEARGKKVKGKLRAFALKNRTAILGALGDAIWRLPGFRRGLFDEVCAVGDHLSRREALVAALDLRWATVRKVRFPIEEDSFSALVLKRAPLLAVERLEQALPAHLTVAAKRRFSWRITDIHLTRVEETLTAIEGDAFPLLRNLEIGGLREQLDDAPTEWVAWPSGLSQKLWNCPMFRQVHVLKIGPIEHTLIGEFIQQCTKLVELREFELTVPSLVLHGRRLGAHFELSVEVAPDLLPEVDIEGVLAQLSKVRLVGVRVEGPARDPLTNRVRAALRALR